MSDSNHSSTPAQPGNGSGTPQAVVSSSAISAVRASGSAAAGTTPLKTLGTTPDFIWHQEASVLTNWTMDQLLNRTDVGGSYKFLQYREPGQSNSFTAPAIADRGKKVLGGGLIKRHYHGCEGGAPTADCPRNCRTPRSRPTRAGRPPTDRDAEVLNMSDDNPNFELSLTPIGRPSDHRYCVSVRWGDVAIHVDTFRIDSSRSRTAFVNRACEEAGGGSNSIVIAATICPKSVRWRRLSVKTITARPEHKRAFVEAGRQTRFGNKRPGQTAISRTNGNTSRPETAKEAPADSNAK
jgi:hypothetical protein